MSIVTVYTGNHETQMRRLCAVLKTAGAGGTSQTRPRQHSVFLQSMLSLVSLLEMQ